MLTKPLQLSQKAGLRKVTSWKVCRKARPSLEQMALARSRYAVSSSRVKEPFLAAETAPQRDWPLSPRLRSPGNPSGLILGGPGSREHSPLAGRRVKPMAGEGEVARESLKVLLRDGPSAFGVVILEHRLRRGAGRGE